MALASSKAIRTLQSSLRHSGRRVTARPCRPARTQLVQRRFASGGGHATGGMPEWMWGLAAVIVTIPSCWYLWPDTSHADAGHHGGHDEHSKHADEHEDKEAETPAEDEAPAEESSSAEESSDESEPAAKDGKEDAKDEGDGDSQPSGQSDSDGVSDAKKSETENKGAFERHIDSGLQKNLDGASQSGESDETNSSETKEKTLSKGNEGDMGNKQSGLSNADTKHSLPIDQDPEKSKKTSGEPETAKSMGTVDPNKPAK